VKMLHFLFGRVRMFGVEFIIPEPFTLAVNRSKLAANLGQRKSSGTNDLDLT